MKKFFAACLLILVSLAMVCIDGFSQVKSGKAPLSKSAVKGVYAGTFQLSNNNVALFYSGSDGISAYEFDSNASFIKVCEGNEALTLLSQANDESLLANRSGAKEFSEVDVMFAGTSWGALKLEKGVLYLKSDDKFIYGLDYEKYESRKLKAEDTWKTMPVGNRAIVPDAMKQVIFKGDNGKYMAFNFAEFGARMMTPLSGYIQSAGIITEKVSVKDPSPYNSNRLVVFKVGGETFEETNNIHVMPFAMQGVGVGASAKGNFVVMTMPLNAPSTVKEQKALVAPEPERNNLYIYEIDHTNNIVSEALHKSDLRTVNFQAVATDDKTFIVGTGEEGKNWRMFYAGQSALSGVTITVLDKDGKITGSRSYTASDFESKFEMAGSGNGKLQKFTGGPNFYQAEKLENGNTFLYGKSDAHHHGMLLSASDELIKYFLFPHADLTKHTMYSDKLIVKGNKVYLVISDQPNELSNELQSSTTSSSTTSGNIKNTTTTTRKTQLFEIYTVSQLFTIDCANGNVNQTVLNEIEKDFLTLGNSTSFFAKDAIYFSGRLKDKGKEVSMIKVPY